MAAALSPELPQNALSNLIMVDIAPTRAESLSEEFTGYFEGMQKIEDAQVNTRQDAQTILAEYEKVRWFPQSIIISVKLLAQDPTIRGFLLTNLLTPPNEPARFKVPLRILGNSLGELADFPQGPDGRTWKDGQVVAIKGKRSKWVHHPQFVFCTGPTGESDRYINKHNLPIMQGMFPGVVLEELDTGHWVHSEA
jgi:hypothetical protein